MFDTVLIIWVVSWIVEMVCLVTYAAAGGRQSTKNTVVSWLERKYPKQADAIITLCLMFLPPLSALYCYGLMSAAIGDTS